MRRRARPQCASTRRRGLVDASTDMRSPRRRVSRAPHRRGARACGALCVVVVVVLLRIFFSARRSSDVNARPGVDALVERVLSPWLARGVSAEAVDAAFEVNQRQDAACFIVQKFGRALFTVGDADARPNRGKWNPGRLFRTRRQNILRLLRRAIEIADDIPDFEATFCLHDCVVSQDRNTSHNMFGTQYEFIPDPVAAFTVVSCVDSMNIPFPTWDYAAGYLRNWDEKWRELRREARSREWDARKGQAVFRGGQRTCVLYPKVGERANGVPFYRVSAKDGENAKKCGRNALLYQALSSTSNHLFDVALTDGVDWRSFGHDELLRPPNKPRLLNKAEQEAFKYQIIAEGECQWANRLRDALFMGTTLILQDLQCVEYYGLELKPWKHYIPVDYWFTNLTQAVVWAENNQQAVKSMNEAKLEYAMQYLTTERIEEFVVKLMRKYAQLLTYSVVKRSGAVEVDFAQLSSDEAAFDTRSKYSNSFLAWRTWIRCAWIRC